MKVLAWYINPNAIENKNIDNYPYPTSISKERWIPHYRYPNAIEKKTTPNQHWWKPTKGRYCINYDIYGWKDNMDGWMSGYGEQAMARNPSMLQSTCGWMNAERSPILFVNFWSHSIELVDKFLGTSDWQNFRLSFHARSLPFWGGGWGPLFVGCRRNGESRRRSELRSLRLR